VSALARWEPKASRSKNERIKVKMGAAQSEGGWKTERVSKLGCGCARNGSMV
jgi:hypothetical protein